MRSLVGSPTLGQTDTPNPRLGSRTFQRPKRHRGAHGSRDIKAPNRYEIVVALTAAVHLALIGYGVVGGFLALRWRHTFWLHVVAGLWGITSVTAHLRCPLTDVERWARARAGMPALPTEGFIGHYIKRVIYPARWKGAVELMAFVMTLVPWTLYAWHGLRRSGSAKRADRAALPGLRR